MHNSQIQSDTDQVLATEKALGAHTYKPLEVILSRGAGVWVWDIDNRKYWIVYLLILLSIRVIVTPGFMRHLWISPSGWH